MHFLYLLRFPYLLLLNPLYLAIECLDLDHDLGDFAWLGGDAIKLLDYLVMEEKFYPIQIHTANPVGRANMERMIARYWPQE